MLKTTLLLIAVFFCGVSVGWFGKGITGGNPPAAFTDNVAGNRNTNTGSFSTFSDSDSLSDPIDAQYQDNRPAAQITRYDAPPGDATVSRTHSSPAATANILTGLLKDKLYFEAILFYQEQKQQGASIASELKTMLLDELNRLLSTGNNSDFSELADNYLSIYYDDIDALLLLAEFNKNNGSYLEVVDVYLLAKTYAYSEIDQQNVNTRFNNFVLEIDNIYSERQDWWSLVNLYTHINAAGLMTSTHQYRQAMAYLRSGDEAFAIDQFNQLLNDSVVGESAAAALNRLTSGVEAPVARSVWDGAESIALQKLGNQYLVNLANNRRDNVKLLIDTGASMTAMSTLAFNALNATGDATQQETRVFRTAGGVVKGLVYVVPELFLGPFSLKNTNVAVIDFEKDQEIDGLLGMNILGQFRFQIDQENSRLLLNRK